jgi:hypothetical protein
VLSRSAAASDGPTTVGTACPGARVARIPVATHGDDDAGKACALSTSDIAARAARQTAGRRRIDSG